MEGRGGEHADAEQGGRTGSSNGQPGTAAHDAGQDAGVAGGGEAPGTPVPQRSGRRAAAAARVFHMADSPPEEGGGKGPPRKRLTKKTPEQVAALEAAFASNPNPSSEECHELSEAWGLTLAQVEQWFGHRRAKERKRAREEESGASGREGAGRGVASLADASRAFSAQPEWAAAAGQGRLPEVAVDPGGFDPVPGEETDGEGAGGTGAGAAGSGKRGTKRRASGAGPETAQDKKRRLEEGRLGKEMERLVARAEEIRARMASREEFRARGGQGKEEERAAGPGAAGGEAMAVDATAEGEAAGQVKGESGEGERGEAGDGGAAEPKGEGEDLAEEDAKDAEALADVEARLAQIQERLAQLEVQREEAEERKARAEEARAKKEREKEQERLLRGMEKEQARLRKEAEKERAKVEREAGKRRSGGRATKEMDKAAKDTLRRMDHKRARLAAEGALSEDQHIEWERVMMPHVERVAEAHGVGAAELRESLREYRVLGDDSIVGMAFRWMDRHAAPPAPAGAPPAPPPVLLEPTPRESQLALAVRDVLRLPDPDLPTFPPDSLGLPPAWVAGFADGVLDGVLEVHGVLHGFACLLGVLPCTVAELALAFEEGQRSQLLSEVFVAALQLLQADMEESLAVMARGGPASASQGDKQPVQTASALLNEAWAWGFEHDLWRAHLNPLTWPEVLRQVAISCGWGPRRKKTVRQVAAGFVAEEVEHPTIPGLTLKLPQEIGPGTVKYAVWHVLATVTSEGLKVEDILERIQNQGIREIGGRTPKITVAGACREGLQQGIFFKVKPGVFALRDVVEHQRGKQPEHGPGGSKIKCGACHHCLNPSHKKACLNPTYINRKEEEEKAEFEEQRLQSMRREWVERLLLGEFDDLPVAERVGACLDLLHLCLEMPSMRGELVARLEEEEAVHKTLADMRAHEKQRKATATATAQALHHHSKILQMQLQTGMSVPLAAPLPPAVVQVLGHSEPRVGEGEGPSPMSEADRAQARHDVQLLAREQERVEHADREAEASFRERERAVAEWRPRRHVRGEPLGSDRRFNRYWILSRGSSRPVLLIESPPSHDRVVSDAVPSPRWRVVATPAQFEGLLRSLDLSGSRERALHAELTRLADELVPEMQRVAGEAGGGSPGPLGWEAEPTTDEALAAYLEDRVDCHAPRADRAHMDVALRPVASTHDTISSNGHADDDGNAESMGQEGERSERRAGSGAEGAPSGSGEPGAAEGGRRDWSTSPLFARVKEDLLAVGGSLSAKAFHAGFDRGAWLAATGPAKTVLALRKCLGELEEAVLLSRFHEAYGVGPRLKLVFGAWLETPGQFATMERAADGWAGVPMEEVLVEDLEWASEVGCSKCQFSNRGCRTCLFRIIEACYTKGQDVPPLVAELAERFQPWPPRPPRPGDDAPDAADPAGAPGQSGGFRPEEYVRPRKLAWLPATLSAVALRLYSMDANAVYRDHGRAARDNLHTYQFILFPVPKAPPPDDLGPQTHAVPVTVAQDALPRACVTEAEEAEMHARETEVEQRQRDTKRKKDGPVKKITIKNIGKAAAGAGGRGGGGAAGGGERPALIKQAEPQQAEPRLAVEAEMLEDELSEEEEEEGKEGSEYNASDDDASMEEDDDD